ncbi:LPXTG cell wall anchor domain-containing protein, partial [Listeria monocytogenes]|nr:LPXTG cell wall anchor domain-containing protein [Listeria monocytogenes]
IKQSIPDDNQDTPDQENGSKGITMTNVILPKTGDGTNALYIILGFLCLGVVVSLGFRRTRTK